ncbi:MAG TPA: hypothetical protein VMU26_20325 [Candidatus Polarisedimenticolia bacterium]|nr:hypothetical protein [Candidatus Polarisedimenticolia bacterium]
MLSWWRAWACVASQLLLRHKTPDVTFRHYVKSDRAELARGLKLLESKLAAETVVVSLECAAA